MYHLFGCALLFVPAITLDLLAENTFLLRICEYFTSSGVQCSSPILHHPRCLVTNRSVFTMESKMPLTLSRKYVAFQSACIGIPPSKGFIVYKVMELCRQVCPKPAAGDDDTYQTVKAGKSSMKIRFHVKKLSWSAAQHVCRSEGGDLVKVDTQSKQKVVEGTIFSRAFKESVWIGLRYEGSVEKFRWVDGTPLRFSQWSFHQPSHYSRSGRKEDCVETGNKRFFGVRWNDRTCDFKLAFICEIS